MNLKFDIDVAFGYKNKSQIARVLTESWVGLNIYCPACGTNKLKDFANNSPVADFYCEKCRSEFELKSKKDSFAQKIVDGAYGTMIERINSDNNPNFFLLNYSERDLIVKNFIVIPKHYFVDDIIERRNPLGQNARRAGWVGCNILLRNIPDSGKIYFVKNGEVVERESVLSNWEKTSFLSNQKNESRGWTIEILKILDKIKSDNFSIKEMYQFEDELKIKFPNNNFVKDKIRQQLQVLRDKGLLEFRGKGSYHKI